MNMIDHYYRQNVTGISAVEFFWGLGLPVIFESTFLSLYLKSLGASSFFIGTIPSSIFLGISIFGLFSSYYASSLIQTRNPVILLHFVSGVSFLIYGLYFFVFGKHSLILIIFSACYSIFAICMGLMIPVWLNYLVKLFSEEKSISGLAIMMLTQNIAKLTSSLLIVHIVEKYSMVSKASALIFMGVGLLFATGSLFFYLTKEDTFSPAKDLLRQKVSFTAYITDAGRHILGNRNFLYFLAADLEYFIVITVISFYATYATLYCGIKQSIASGIFVTFIYTGAILSNIGFGSFGFFSLKNKYIVSKVITLSGLTILICFNEMWSFLTASFLLGISRGTRMIVFAPSIKKLSRLSDSTSYFAVSPILTLPFAAGFPLVCGKCIDSFPQYGADTYRLIFAISAVLTLFTMAFMMKTEFSDQPPIRVSCPEKRSDEKSEEMV